MVKVFQAKTFNEIPGGDAANLIPIFPAGTVKGVDGRGPYIMKDPATVIAASVREHVDLVIDRDHQTDYLPAGTAIKAAGWIKGLVEKGGAIFAEVEWTPAAAQELKDREYRYISPTFTFDKSSGIVRRILRATLTNTPNFDMKAVASAQHNYEPDEPEEENDPMKINAMLLACAAALGVSEPKTEEEVLELVKATASQLAATKASLTTATENLTATAKALGLKDDEKSETIIATASTIKATADQKVTETDKESVPMSMYKETAAQLSELQKTISEDKATAAVSAAMKAGKVTPAQKEWALGRAKSDLSDFEKFISSAPVIATASEEVQGKPKGDGALTDEDKATCAQLGISEEDFKKAAA